MSHPQRGGMLGEQPAPRGAGNETLRVLIADDEQPIAEALGDIVVEEGLHAVLAINGQRALELARLERPVLVITDYMMPYMNGVQLMLALREEARSHGEQAPPVVIMSAAQSLLPRGISADAIIRKPFDIAEVEAIVRRFAGGLRQTGA